MNEQTEQPQPKPLVVVADDSPTMRRIVTHVLTRAGFEVLAVEDGVEAVQAVFRHLPAAVVLDVQMPGLSGYVATRLLKDDWVTAGIPCILLTGLDAASDRYWGGLAGGDRYVTKDFEADDLARTVTEVVARAARAGRHRPHPGGIELTARDVLERTCDVLDRTLYATRLAADITGLAATCQGFEPTVAGLLEVLGRVVDHTVAGVVLAPGTPDAGAAYLTVARAAGHDHLVELLDRSADALAAVDPEHPLGGEDLDPRVMDPTGLFGQDDAPLDAFLSVPLRGASGRLLGVLVFSTTEDAPFTDATLATLRHVEQPASLLLAAALAGATPVPLPAVVGQLLEVQ